MSRSPGRSVSTLVAAAVTAMGVGVGIGHFVRSPAQRALDTAPPAKATITAGVTAGSATVTIVSRGTVHVGTTVSVGPVPSAAALAIVTGVYVAPGALVRPGARLIEVSGRPVLLLQGQFRAYRNLAIGDSGPDASQLNSALRRLKLGAPSGAMFTGRTASALAKLYRQAGYTPPAGGGLLMREVAFIPAGSASVQAVAGQVGSSAKSADLVVLSSGETSVEVHLDPDQARQIHEGDSAQVFIDTDGGQVNAVVNHIDLGTAAGSTSLTLRPLSPIPASANGSDVRVVIAHERQAAGLSVPVTAVYSRDDGQTVVVVVDAQGAQRVVPVTVTPVTGAGVVDVSPTSAEARLEVGDQVIVSGPGFN